MLVKKLLMPVLISTALLAGMAASQSDARREVGRSSVAERLVSRTMPPSDPGPKKPRLFAPNHA